MTNEITVKDIVIYPDAYPTKKRGKDIELIHREFELFHYLSEHVGQVMTREHLLQTVQDYDYSGDIRTVDVTIHRLREKIEDGPLYPEYIMTCRDVGYLLQQYEQRSKRMKWLKQLQSLHARLITVYVLLIIIGMQITGSHFTNNLEKELFDNFEKNITQCAEQLGISIKKAYDEKGSMNIQKDIQNLLSEYANHQKTGEIHFIDKDRIITATTKQSNRSLINRKANNSSV